MKPCHLTATSKNKKSISGSLFFFFNALKDLNFKVVSKYFQKRKEREILTILKSPHVNKKAQEQFETRYFSGQISVYVAQNLRYLVFLKKIQTQLFPDIKIKAKFSINHKITKKQREKILDPNNFYLNSFGKKISQSLKLQQQKNLKVEYYDKTKPELNNQVQKFLKIIDIYGELTR